MKILWFIRFQIDVAYLRQNARFAICRELEAMGHIVKLAIEGDRKTLKTYDAKKYVRIPAPRKSILKILSFWAIGYFKFLCNYFIFRPDAIVLDVNSFMFSAPFSLLPSRYRPVFVIDSRTSVYKPYAGKLTPRFKIREFLWNLSFRYAKIFLDGAVVTTAHYKELLCGRFNFKPEALLVRGSGVDLSLFCAEKYNNSERPPFLKGKFVLMQHGELSDDRGLFEMVRSLGYIPEKDVCFLHLGGDLPGRRIKEELVREVEKLKLTDRVYFLPPVRHADVARYISYCDCAILAYPAIEYWDNNSPLKLAEYLAMGKVVICTDIWAFRSVMGDNKCACYIKDNDPETIAAAIRYCRDNTGLLKGWGSEGTDIARRELSWEKRAKDMSDFIYRLKTTNDF